MDTVIFMTLEIQLMNLTDTSIFMTMFCLIVNCYVTGGNETWTDLRLVSRDHNGYVVSTSTMHVLISLFVDFIKTQVVIYEIHMTLSTKILKIHIEIDSENVNLLR